MSEPTEKPPVFNTWRAWYLLVAGVLLLEMIVFYCITRAFA
jgi:hypothetical protein